MRSTRGSTDTEFSSLSCMHTTTSAQLQFAQSRFIHLSPKEPCKQFPRSTPNRQPPLTAASGRVFAWGSNKFGQLGLVRAHLLDTSDELEPHFVHFQHMTRASHRPESSVHVCLCCLSLFWQLCVHSPTSRTERRLSRSLYPPG